MQREWIMRLALVATAVLAVLVVESHTAEAQGATGAHCERILPPMPGVAETTADRTANWMSAQLLAGRDQFVYGDGLWCAW